MTKRTLHRQPKKGPEEATNIGAYAYRIASRFASQHRETIRRIRCDWIHIVGKEYANDCVPIDLRFPKGKKTNGTLHCRVHTQLMATASHYHAPQLIERINRYFGYGAVSSVRLHIVPEQGGEDGKS